MVRKAFMIRAKMKTCLRALEFVYGLALILSTSQLVAGMPNQTKQKQITCVDVFPGGKPQLAIEDKHFPTRLHAFVWRNWESVSLERMAKTVDTKPQNIREIGLSMGLPEKIG